MVEIRRAVILAAGRGTRFLPATKSVPKELLPVVDKPLIQYCVEEAVAAGMTEIVIVDAAGKEAIRRHFGPDRGLQTFLRERGKPELAEEVAEIERLARFSFVQQTEQLGVADAVRAARELVEGEPFALMFPDDVLIGPPVIGQLAGAYREGVGAVLAVQEVPWEEVRQYGVVAATTGANPAAVSAVVEKPEPPEAPSNLAIVGRYILGPTIFEHIDRIEPSAGGELQITDAFASQIQVGEPVLAYRFSGTRYDTGRPAGMVAATIAMALERPDLRDAVREQIGRVPSEPSEVT